MVQSCRYLRPILGNAIHNEPFSGARVRTWHDDELDITIRPESGHIARIDWALKESDNDIRRRTWSDTGAWRRILRMTQR